MHNQVAPLFVTIIMTVIPLGLLPYIIELRLFTDSTLLHCRSRVLFYTNTLHVNKCPHYVAIKFSTITIFCVKLNCVDIKVKFSSHQRSYRSAIWLCFFNFFRLHYPCFLCHCSFWIGHVFLDWCLWRGSISISEYIILLDFCGWKGQMTS